MGRRWGWRRVEGGVGLLRDIEHQRVAKPLSHDHSPDALPPGYQKAAFQLDLTIPHLDFRCPERGRASSEGVKSKPAFRFTTLPASSLASRVVQVLEFLPGSRSSSGLPIS